MGKIWRVSSTGVTCSDLSFTKIAPFHLSNPTCHNTRPGHKPLSPEVLHPVSSSHCFSPQTHAPRWNQRNSKTNNKPPRNLITSLSCFKSLNDFPMPLGQNPNFLTGFHALWLMFTFPASSLTTFLHTLQIHWTSFSYSNEPCSLSPRPSVLQAWARILPSSVQAGDFLQLHSSNLWLCEVSC